MCLCALNYLSGCVCTRVCVCVFLWDGIIAGCLKAIAVRLSHDPSDLSETSDGACSVMTSGAEHCQQEIDVCECQRSQTSALRAN